MSISATTGYPILKRHRPPPFMLTRVCATCKHFWGPTKTGPGECRKLLALTYGRDSARDCGHWTRRMAGVDPVPFGVAPRVDPVAAPPPPPPPPPPPAPAHPVTVEPTPVARRPGPKPSTVVAARRDRVAELARTGMPGPEIAAVIGISLKTVWKDARQRSAALSGRGGPTRRDQVLALAETGMTGAQIARELGMTRSGVSQHLMRRAGE